MAEEKLVLAFPAHSWRGSRLAFVLRSIDGNKAPIAPLPSNAHILERVQGLDINLFRGELHAVLLPGRAPYLVLFEKDRQWKTVRQLPAQYTELASQALAFLNSTKQ